MLISSLDNSNNKGYPIAYGIIPKRKKKQFNKEAKNMTCTEDELPTITIASYFISIFNNYFGNDASIPAKPKLINKNGLMPHSTKRKTDAHITPQTVTAPITMIGGVDTKDEYDDYLSKSNSSTSSSVSSFSTLSNGSSHSQHRRSVCSLSEILCEHYVQKAALNNNTSDVVDVPLETYKVFEASRRRSSSSSVSSLKLNENSNENEDEDDDESWFIWDNLQKTKKWIQVVDEELFLPREQTTTEIAIVEQPPQKVRGIRANPAHLRMIVAEVNMMRSNKIVGPLRPRGFLSAKRAAFISNQSSPLKLPI